MIKSCQLNARFDGMNDCVDTCSCLIMLQHTQMMYRLRGQAVASSKLGHTNLDTCKTNDVHTLQ